MRHSGGDSSPTSVSPSSRTRRDFPIPGSPTMVTRCGSAVAPTRRYVARSSSSSGSRPTNTGRNPATPRGRMSPRASKIGNAASRPALPLASIDLRAPNSNAPAAAAAVRSLASTSPGSAAFWNRSATFTASPMTNEPPSRGAPTTTSPVLTPTLISSSPRKSSRSRACIASAACSERSTWSSKATGAPNTAITASPANFSTMPPLSSISSRIAS